MWSIIWEDNRLKPYSTGFRKFFLLLYLLFFRYFLQLWGYGSAQESIMRLDSPKIAQELMKELRRSIEL